ncbi:MAG: hypothetical protein GY719_08550 [bacterium]|nr:hypothetical protein [bacterium]
MKDITKQSLGELKALYNRKIEFWTKKKLEHEKEIDKCRREIKACQTKLRHVEALVSAPAGAPKAAPKVTRRRGKRRRRTSPVKIATLQALRNRPGERLTTKRLLTAIRHDTGKRVSRQSVNVNLGLLEKEGLIKKFPAPRGAGARFVYSAVPSA